MGPGQIHLVATLKPPSSQYSICVTTGYHFYAEATLYQSMYAGIDHAVWHRFQTNTTHDDCDFAKAHIITLLDLSIKAKSQLKRGDVIPTDNLDRRLSDQAQFSLLYMARYPDYGRSLEDSDILSLLKKKGIPPSANEALCEVRNEMRSRALNILRTFSPEKRERWRQFRDSVHKYVSQQLQLRWKQIQYDKPQDEDEQEQEGTTELESEDDEGPPAPIESEDDEGLPAPKRLRRSRA